MYNERTYHGIAADCGHSVTPHVIYIGWTRASDLKKENNEEAKIPAENSLTIFAGDFIEF